MPLSDLIAEEDRRMRDPHQLHEQQQGDSSASASSASSPYHQPADGHADRTSFAPPRFDYRLNDGNLHASASPSVARGSSAHHHHLAHASSINNGSLRPDEADYAPSDEPDDRAARYYRQYQPPHRQEQRASDGGVRGPLQLPPVLHVLPPPPSQPLLDARHAQQLAYRPSSSSALRSRPPSQQAVTYAPQYRPSHPASWSQAAYGPEDDMSWRAQRPPPPPPPLPFPTEGGPVRHSRMEYRPHPAYSPYPAPVRSAHLSHTHHAPPYEHRQQQQQRYPPQPHAHQPTYQPGSRRPPPPPPSTHGRSLAPGHHHFAHPSHQPGYGPPAHPPYRYPQPQQTTPPVQVPWSDETPHSLEAANEHGPEHEHEPEHDDGHSHRSFGEDELSSDAGYGQITVAQATTPGGGARPKWSIPPIESLLPERQFANGERLLPVPSPPAPSSVDLAQAVAEPDQGVLRRRGRTGEWSVEVSAESTERVYKRRPPVSQVRNACGHCKKLHKPCDDARPCQRCVDKGTAETCADSARKPKREKQPPAPKKKKSKGKGKARGKGNRQKAELGAGGSLRDLPYDAQAGQTSVDPTAHESFEQQQPAYSHSAEYGAFPAAPALAPFGASSALSHPAFHVDLPPAGYSSYQPPSPSADSGTGSSSYDDAGGDVGSESAGHWTDLPLPSVNEYLDRLPASSAHAGGSYRLEAQPAWSSGRPSHMMSMSAAPQHYRPVQDLLDIDDELIR